MVHGGPVCLRGSKWFNITTYHACLKPTRDSDRHFMSVQIIAQAVGPAFQLFIPNPFRHFLQAWLFAVHQNADAVDFTAEPDEEDGSGVEHAE